MKLVTTLAGPVRRIAVGTAQADITVGVSISATGPAASLGISEKNAIAMMPTSIGKEKIYADQPDTDVIVQHGWNI